MKVQLIRHATVLLEITGHKILLDPMLSQAGIMSAVPDVANTSNNPLVELPMAIDFLSEIDAVLLTHTHRDHFDEAAKQLLPRDKQFFCQPVDLDKLQEAGFSRVQTVEDVVEWQGIQISRTGGQHGSGEIGRQMGPVSGYVLQAQNEPSLYIAGDTIWCAEVETALEKYQPQVIICFAGAASFSSGGPITMDLDGINQICKKAPAAKVIIVHMEAWNHCGLSRQELKAFRQNNNLEGILFVPDDGEELTF